MPKAAGIDWNQDRIILGAGEYVANEPIVIDHEAGYLGAVQIIGSGQSETLLHGTGDFPVIHALEPVSLHNLRVTGPDANGGTGLLMRHGYIGALTEDVVFENLRRGIDIEGPYGYPKVVHFAQIHRTTFNQIGEYGIHIPYGHHCQQIVGCNFIVGPNAASIYLDYVSGIVIERCLFLVPRSPSIVLRGSYSIQIHNCGFDGSYSPGIDIGDTGPGYPDIGIPANYPAKAIFISGLQWVHDDASPGAGIRARNVRGLYLRDNFVVQEPLADVDGSVTDFHESGTVAL